MALLLSTILYLLNLVPGWLFGITVDAVIHWARRRSFSRKEEAIQEAPRPPGYKISSRSIAHPDGSREEHLTMIIPPESFAECASLFFQRERAPGQGRPLDGNN